MIADQKNSAVVLLHDSIISNMGEHSVSIRSRYTGPTDKIRKILKN